MFSAVAFNGCGTHTALPMLCCFVGCGVWVTYKHDDEKLEKKKKNTKN